MKLFDKIYNGFIKVFGDIKIFKFPMFILYDPGSYRVKGDDTREVLDIVKPGDILLRGYVNYLDGYIIPGFFSHAGLYLGEVKPEDATTLSNEQLTDFKAGKQIVIHSMAEGVFMEDVLNFCRCDFMMILRRDAAKESAQAQSYIFDKVFTQALKDLGKEYDFKFDFSDFHKLSCTELVYDACQGFIEEYGIKPKERTVMLMKKRLITPDDYANSPLTLVWKSRSIDDNK